MGLEYFHRAYVWTTHTYRICIRIYTWALSSEHQDLGEPIRSQRVFADYFHATALDETSTYFADVMHCAIKIVYWF